MALIKNTGSYTVRIGISDLEKKPGDKWIYKGFDPATKTPFDIDPDVGSGSQNIQEGDCRYINAKHLKASEQYFVTAIASDNHVLTSAQIKAHEFWVFDGENFYEREDLEQKDCKKCHGS